jgi:tetratricopeptide (TPR) repeat protein
MGNSARLLVLTMCLVLPCAALALADPAQDFHAAIADVKAGDVDKALVDITRVIEAGASMEPRNLSNAYNFRGMCLEEKKQFQEALADYTKAIEVFDKAAEAYGNRALLYAKLGDTDKAKADAVAAKRIDRKVKVPTFDK